MYVARWGSFGRVDVGVSVNPEQADLLLPAAIELRHARHRSGRQRVVAAQQERGLARFKRCYHGFGRAGAGLRNLFQIVGAFVASGLRFGNLDADVTGIRDAVAESFKARFEPRDAHRGRPHIHAAPAGAQVQRHTDHADTVRWLHRAAGRNFAGSGGTKRWFADYRHTYTSMKRRWALPRHLRLQDANLPAARRIIPSCPTPKYYSTSLLQE